MCKIDLRKIVTKLSFKQRIIFNEIVLHGKSRTQTAEKLGISVQAVSKTYNKALAAITKYLQKGRE